jgi:hypothetical protein
MIFNNDSFALDVFLLVSEDQYLHLIFSAPLEANIYGLGERVASSRFRRDSDINGGAGNVHAH